jgi:signal transduction histidine kinase
MTSFFIRGPYFSGSVRARLLRLALLLLLPGLLISVLLTWQVFRTEREGAETALRETARGLSQVIDREFLQAEVLLRTLAATDELRQGNLAALDRLARATAVMGGTVVLIDPTGQELIDTGRPAGARLPRRPLPGDWSREAAGRVDISTTAATPDAPFSIRVLLPVSLPPAGHVYDLELLVPPASLQTVLLREKLPQGWIAAVLDDHRIIVARSVRQELFVGRSARTGLLRALTDSSDGVRDSLSLDNIPVVVAYHRSAQTGWTASVNAPRASIAEAGRQSTMLLVWLGSFAILLGLLGALHVARGIAGRIEAMARAARILGQTESWTPIPVGLDEADAVSEAMRSAAASLIERRAALSELNETLAARVEARTAELAMANRALDDQRRQLGAILDQLPAGVVVHGEDGGVQFANLEARRLLGLPASGPIEAGQWPPVRRGSKVLEAAEQPWVLAANGVVTERMLLNIECAGGGQLDLEVSVCPLMRESEGHVVLSVTALQDVTARLEAEEARRRSQRLEAVGQLTGGVAHEFNNLLMAISGCLELLTPFVQVGRGPRLLANAARATERGGRLTRQLLAFARRQNLQPEPVDLNQLVAGMTELLESTLGRAFQVIASLDPEAWPAMADASQLELVLLNLAINARDAMPGGGKLTIRTGNARTGSPLRAEDPPAGEYALLDISDTGHGMTPQVQARAFEPFFTTKEVGLGSGLGLPQVLGVAQQLGGGVSITSVVDKGTTVRVYLPRATAAPGRTQRQEQPAGAGDWLAGARLLVVDDDSDVREIARDMLAEMGASVIEADGAAAALLHLRTGAGVDLVLADLTMPHVNGLELASEIAALLPDLPVVLMTGYGVSAANNAGSNIRATLQKPFRADTLGKLLAGVLGRNADALIARV